MRHVPCAQPLASPRPVCTPCPTSLAVSIASTAVERTKFIVSGAPGAVVSLTGYLEDEEDDGACLVSCDLCLVSVSVCL